MKNYELTYLISPELKTEEAERFSLEISAFLQKEEGSVIKTENPKPKTLSYQIKKQGAAFQTSLEFCSTPEGLKTLEEKIKKESKILRYLIVVKKPPQRERRKKTISMTKPSRILDKVGTESVEIKIESSTEKPRKTEKKAELKDIEEKLEKILKE